MSAALGESTILTLLGSQDGTKIGPRSPQDGLKTDQKFDRFSRRFFDRFLVVLGPSWRPFGASWGLRVSSWGRLGALLGPSWGSLGPSWGHLEASRAHRKRKGEKAKNSDFPLVLEPFWSLGGVLGALGGHLKPSRGRLRASWMRVGGYLEPS